MLPGNKRRVGRRKNPKRGCTARSCLLTGLFGFVTVLMMAGIAALVVKMFTKKRHPIRAEPKLQYPAQPAQNTDCSWHLGLRSESFKLRMRRSYGNNATGWAWGFATLGIGNAIMSRKSAAYVTIVTAYLDETGRVKHYELREDGSRHCCFHINKVSQPDNGSYKRKRTGVLTRCKLGLTKAGKHGSGWACDRWLYIGNALTSEDGVYHVNGAGELDSLKFLRFLAEQDTNSGQNWLQQAVGLNSQGNFASESVDDAPTVPDYTGGGNLQSVTEDSTSTELPDQSVPQP